MIVFVADDFQSKRFPVGNTLLLPDVPYRRHGLFHQFETRQQGIVPCSCPRHVAHHDALSLQTRGKVLPQLLGNEGHEGVQHAQQLIEERFGLGKGLPVGRHPVCGFHHLQIPPGKFVPEQPVNLHEASEMR